MERGGLEDEPAVELEGAGVCELGCARFDWVKCVREKAQRDFIAHKWSEQRSRRRAVSFEI
jgi:hypothetical protein